MISKHSIGAEYETRAAALLENLGYRILCRNYRCRAGEIDLVAQAEGYLVFIEVKYRSSMRNGSASEAVGKRKQQRLISAARSYMTENHLPENQACRFDVVAFDGRDMQVIPDAFWS